MNWVMFSLCLACHSLIAVMLQELWLKIECFEYESNLCLLSDEKISGHVLMNVADRIIINGGGAT